MKRTEFLQELEIALEGTMPDEDIKLVLECYETMFYNGFLDGKQEEIIAAELGSPARIVKGILAVTEEERGEVHTGDAVTEALTSRFLKTDPRIFGMSLASMRSRVRAYLFDAALITIVTVILVTVPQAAYHMIKMINGSEPRYLYESAYYYIFGADGAISLISPFLIFVFLGAFNVVTALFLWRTNGYTPGKKLLHIRVVRLDGREMTLKRAVLRDIGVKFFLNGITTGFLNGVSLVWGFSTIDKKTVHDSVAKTVVVSDFTKDELKAMSSDRKYAKEKRRAKTKELQRKRLGEKEAQRQEKARERAKKKQQPKPRELAKDQREQHKRDIAIAKARKRQDGAKARAQRRIEAEAAKLARKDERMAAKGMAAANVKNKPSNSSSGDNASGKITETLPEHQVKRGLNADELATIERIKANLEEQKRRTEEELFGLTASTQVRKPGGSGSPEDGAADSDENKGQSSGPTIIFKDHN